MDDQAQAARAGAEAPAPGSGPEVAGVDKETYVRSLFDHIAGAYDRMNVLMTGGAVLLWHRAFARFTGLRPGGRAVDVCCGTGDLTGVMARQVGAAGRVVGIDFSEPMLRVGRRRLAGAPWARTARLDLANALALPFADDTFDCAAIGFALRNVADIPAALAEMARVVRPGGRVVALEISRPKSRWIRTLFSWYFDNVVPLLGRLAERAAVRDPRLRRLRPYTYLPRSLRGLPDQDALAALFRRAGLVDVGWRGLTGGVVTIYHGTKPAPGGPAP